MFVVEEFESQYFQVNFFPSHKAHCKKESASKILRTIRSYSIELKKPYIYIYRYKGENRRLSDWN